VNVGQTFQFFWALGPYRHIQPTSYHRIAATAQACSLVGGFLAIDQAMPQPHPRRRSSLSPPLPDSSRKNPTDLRLSGSACRRARAACAPAVSRRLQKMHPGTSPFPLLLPPSTRFSPPRAPSDQARTATVALLSAGSSPGPDPGDPPSPGQVSDLSSPLPLLRTVISLLVAVPCRHVLACYSMLLNAARPHSAVRTGAIISEFVCTLLM
jgi:hypothetical protein